ncbi:MAG: hypothetical protein AAF514_04440 [Verrucomicrobiota bacterium]
MADEALCRDYEAVIPIPADKMAQPLECPGKHRMIPDRSLLLILFFPLFWIGLLMNEYYYTCDLCGIRRS